MMVSRRLVRGIILALALGLTMVLVAGVWKGGSQKELQTAQTTDKSDAEMTLKDMEYTELQEGKRLWTLRADEARYFQDEQKTVLSSVHITFFMENGEEVYLESQQGVLYAGTKNIELWDSVRAMLPRGYQLSSDRAFYDHQKKAISSGTPIQLQGPDVQLEGTEWEYRIPEYKAVVGGGVRGALVFLPPKTRAIQ